jgi:tetratricopeptide (TPR) repeat protein
MSDRIRKREIFPVIIVAAITLFTQSYIFIELLYAHIGVHSALVWHVGIFFAHLLAIGVLSVLRLEFSYIILLALLAFVGGPLGTALTLLSMVLYLYFSRDAVSFSDWLAALLPEQQEDQEEVVFDEIEVMDSYRFLDTTDVTNYRDVLALGTLVQKRRILSNMLHHYQPEFGPIFLMALEDTDNAVRVQAATAIAKLRKNYSDAIYKNKVDFKRFGMRNALSLANAYDDFLQSGIITQEKADEIRSKSIELYEYYLERYPNSRKIKIALGRKYLQNGQPEKAEPYLSLCLKKKGVINPRKFIRAGEI